MNIIKRFFFKNNFYISFLRFIYKFVCYSFNFYMNFETPINVCATSV